jgi:hypothetical protein
MALLYFNFESTHLFEGRTFLWIPTEFDYGDKNSYGQSAQQDNKNTTCTIQKMLAIIFTISNQPREKTKEKAIEK